jgi:hypothetical protein
MATGKLTSKVRLIGVLVACATAVSLVVSAASAFANTPAWSIRSYAAPAKLAPGGTGEIVVVATSLGDANVNASVAPVAIGDKLPPGLTATSIAASGGFGAAVGLSCSLEALSCEGASGEVEPYGSLTVRIAVEVAKTMASPSSSVNEASVSGGGADSESSSEKVSFDATPAGFGVEQFEQLALNENGSPDTQAGSHPATYTTFLQLNPGASPLVKDLHFDIPPGVIGNPTVIPQCTFEQFSTHAAAASRYSNLCPDDTVVGTAMVWLGTYGFPSPVFNLTPNVGEPARFAMLILGVPVFLDTSVRTGGDYGVVVDVDNISTVLPFTASQLTFWGAPADPSHDQSRGWNCLFGGVFAGGALGPCPVTPAGGAKPPPFLTMPTSCAGSLHSTVQADSWKEPGVFREAEYNWHDSTGALAMDGCTRLPFEPSLIVTPDGQNASTPTGLAVTEHVPQEVTLNPTGLAEADVKDTTVTLPEGVQISPAGGDGLLACSLAQVGFQGADAQGQLEFSSEEQTCPEASKVGTVEIQTPLLPNPLKGAVYLAAQNANPFGSLVAMYVVAKDPVSGVLVKAAGEVTLNQATGQLVTTFKNTPQLPYENLELHFFGSARAPLTTPPTCGSYTTHASIEGYAGNPPSEPSSTFQITAGPAGAPCADPQPFAPGFDAGTTNIQAGAFTPFQLTMSRPDADQTLSRVEMHMPPGLLGTLSTVKLCPEPQAAQGTCGEDSLIGRTTVSAGLGDSPYTVTGGKVFVTGPYKGAPYGLSIVNPAVAGPFNLGTVVVRAQIRVDPHTAALTIISDPLPTMLDGIPLQIQHVQVAVERAGGFTFNATNCEPMQITGTLTSTDGASASEASRYQVTNCLALAFKPKLTASTDGKTSRADGASLTVKLGYPAGPYDANIAKVKVELPKALPSRLTTLQKACLAATFEANPANCPAASLVGHATATTPVLPVPLTGPAYFVSHGGEAFPSLIVVLQGYGTTVDLVGSTFISKQGITSSTFKTVPDVPVGTFELTIPEGPYSALSANANLCKSKLAMPTEFVAQNGVVLKQSTKIEATGCPKAKQVKHRRKTRRKRARGKSGGGKARHGKRK